MSIKRYYMHGPSGYDDWGCEPSNAGRWVEYSDHLADKEAALAAQAERVKLDADARPRCRDAQPEGICLNHPHGCPGALSAAQAELAALRERVRFLSEHLEATSDGVLVIDCDKLYCPKCKGVVRQEYDICYCDECVNPDDGGWPNSPPLPLLYGSCLSKPLDSASQL